MTSNRIGARISTLAALLCSSATAPAYAAPQIWFGGEDPITVRDKHRAGPHDYMQLFAPDSPWQHAEAGLQVFKISTQFALGAPEEDVRTAFDTMHAHHIQMAIEIGTVVRLDSCGKGEGYAPPNLSDRVGSRLKRLGVTLDYMAADNPVWNAHERTWGLSPGGAPNCEYPVPVVAQRVAMSFNAMRRYFPALQIGETDVISSDHVEPHQLIDDYIRFAAALAANIGQKMAFFQTDIAWHTEYQPMLVNLRQQMHATGVPVGYIIGGSPEYTDPISWGRVAIQRLQVLMEDPATRPDQVVMQSWQPLPMQYLPDSEPGTATYNLLRAEQIAR